MWVSMSTAGGGSWAAGGREGRAGEPRGTHATHQSVLAGPSGIQHGADAIAHHGINQPLCVVANALAAAILAAAAGCRQRLDRDPGELAAQGCGPAAVSWQRLCCCCCCCRGGRRCDWQRRLQVLRAARGGAAGVGALCHPLLGSRRCCLLCRAQGGAGKGAGPVGTRACRAGAKEAGFFSGLWWVRGRRPHAML